MTAHVLSCFVILCALPAARAQDAAPVKPGVVFVIGGAGGMDFGQESTEWAFKQAKVPHVLREFKWSHGKGRVLRDLQDTRHLIAKAEELAEVVKQYKQDYPDQPVYFIARSTGTAIALEAAARLPDATVEKIILLCSALSPHYNLVPALRATRDEIISFRSDYDGFILGWGTSTFGTADRRYVDSAGKTGFHLPAHDALTRLYYLRLVQITWKPRLLWLGHLGGHVGCNSPLFLLHEVAPKVQLPAEK